MPWEQQESNQKHNIANSLHSRSPILAKKALPVSKLRLPANAGTRTLLKLGKMKIFQHPGKRRNWIVEK